MQPDSRAARWSVAAMIREDPEVVRRYVAHYLRAGAERIRIYWDGERPADWPLPEDERVEIAWCTLDWWAETFGGRPDEFEACQSLLFTHGLRASTEADWVLFADCDELVFPADRIAPMLAAVPAHVVSVAVPTAEAVFKGDGDQEEIFGATRFRTRLRRRHALLLQPLLYGGAAPLLRQGLAGHVFGKQFVRTSAPEGTEVLVHWSTVDGRRATANLADLGPGAPRLWLGHFDAVSRPHWIEKMRRRIDREMIEPAKASKERTAIVERFERHWRSKDDGLGGLFRSIYHLPWWKFAALRLVGAAFEDDVGPRSRDPR